MEAAVRWSPHSGDRERFLLVDVIDQSVTLHQVHQRSRKHLEYTAVARHGRLPNFGAFDWSRSDESIVALGLVSGSASLIRLRDDDRSSETIATFKLKQQRKCNSIALSTQHWLAVALDKTRSDVCLNIYDAHSDHESHQDPLRRLCPAEVVSSVRFLPSRPQEIIVGAQRSSVRLYDLRDGYVTSGNVQVSTRNVNNIAIDPQDDNYFASAGSTDDPAVSVWDRRWMSQSAASASGSGAVFEFRPAVDDAVRTTIWSLRYSGQQRGQLAICSSRGELKVIDMVEGRSSLLRASEYLPSNPHGGTAWTSNRYVARTRSIATPSDDFRDESLIDSRVIAFDWITGGSSAIEQDILALRPNRHIELLGVSTSTPLTTVTARNDLSLAFDGISITEPRMFSRKAEMLFPATANVEVELVRSNEERVKCTPDSAHLASMLAPNVLPHERCRHGYLFDCARNRELVAGHQQLERLWEIIGRFQEQASHGAMIAEDLDLSYVGVAGICSENIGNSARRTLSPSIAKVEDAVCALNIARELPPFEGERTEYPEHRQLALEACGWKFTTETLEAECQELIDRGLYYRAIVQAVLHNYKHIALNLLRMLIRSKTVPNIGLGALLACDSLNEDQREMCEWMAADTDDPALKALLTFLISGNWRDVMKTNYLHLGYRVALGLKYLNDTELAGFIQGETARAIKNGDLEGILLTGLGEQSMNLLQTYVTKTDDLQSAVLASAFTNPLYVDDVRWEMWKETYFMQMQSWRAFAQRTQFVVGHSRMARTKAGRSLKDAPAVQIVLRCNHCQLSLAKRDGRSNTQKTRPESSNATSISSPATSAGVVCPKCGRHMPRCGICQTWLGTPDPARQGGAYELQKLNDVMSKFLTFCVKCRHGFHADHARDWFRKHSTCPVPDCRCLCFVA